MSTPNLIRGTQIVIRTNDITIHGPFTIQTVADGTVNIPTGYRCAVEQGPRGRFERVLQLTRIDEP